MSNNNQKKFVLKIFYILNIILTVLLILVLIPFGSFKKKGFIYKSLIDSEKNFLPSQIVLTDSDKQISLMNEGQFWKGTDFSAENFSYWPCDTERVQNFIESSTKNIKMYKISDSYRKSAFFLLGADSAFCISFYDFSGNCLSTVYFGSADYITGRINIRFEGSDSVYQIEDFITPFLTVSESSWCDPYIFPDILTGYTKVQKQNSLRRGKLVSEVSGLPVFESLRFNFGNGRYAVYSVYKSDDGYILKSKLYRGPADSELYGSSLESLNYSFSVSEWTYEKLRKSEVNNE